MNGAQSEDGKEIDRQWEANKAAADAKRPEEAQERGGWIYTVGLHQTPIMVAQHYGGRRPGVLAELLAVNPKMEHGPCGTCRSCMEASAGGGVALEEQCEKPCVRWDRRRWFIGAGVLLPVAWGDPRLRPELPPLRPANQKMRDAIAASSERAKTKRAAK